MRFHQSVNSFSFSSEFIPRRFIWQQSPEMGGLDEGGDAMGGVSEEASERMAEQMREARKAQKKAKKDEKKAKKRDSQLADFIKQFLQSTAQNERYVVFITRLLERNTPVNLILAVLSLHFSEVEEILMNLLEDEQELFPEEVPNSSILSSSQSLVPYGQELGQNLQQWTRRIFAFASFHPMKTILSLAQHYGVDSNMLNLTQAMIVEFLQSNHQEINLEQVQEFCNLFWRDTLKKLHVMADKQGLLPTPEGETQEVDDDDDDDF